MPAAAFATALAITLASVAVLVAARNLGRTSPTATRSSSVVSPAHVETPAVTASPSPAPGSTLIWLSAPSAAVVWALVDYNHLYRSTDQGNHWELRSVFAGPLRAVSFLNDQQGWLLGSGPVTDCEGSASIIHTTDGGSTWQDWQATGISPSQCKRGIWFVDDAHGFVAASDSESRPTIYRTSSGGWAATTLQDPAYFRSRPGGFTLQVDWVKKLGGTLYLEAFGKQDTPGVPVDNQFILASTDEGATWRYVTKTPSRSVVMVTELRWLDFTTPDQPMESTNGGQQFHPYTSDFDSASTQLMFTDANVGYAWGPALIQKTTDGGAHWTRLLAPGTAPPLPTPPAWLSGVELSAPSATVVWALVGGQHLFASTDQGRTWELRKVARAPAQGLSQAPLISFVDATTGWEVVPTSEDGDCTHEAVELWRTTDGASTWNLVAQTHPDPTPYGEIPIDQCKDALYFRDSTHGSFVVQDSRTDTATMFRSEDSGMTWNPQGFLRRPENGDTRAFRVVSIRTVDGIELMEAHENGRPVRLVLLPDRTVTVPDQAVSNVAFLTATHWLIVQPGLETADAGQTWHSFTTDFSDARGVPGAFVFADASVGYATVQGDVQRTTDSGAHWELIKASWP
jgi:photosystem II stability/assembly factor-like uncharacterized protein